MQPKQFELAPGLVPLFRQAEMALAGGNLPAAERAVRQLLTKAPQFSPAMHLLAEIAYQVGRYVDALSLAKQAQQNAFPYLPFLIQQAIIEQAMGDFTAAEETLLAGQRLEPGNPMTAIHRAIGLAHLCQMAASQDQFLLAIKTGCHDIKLFARLAEIANAHDEKKLAFAICRIMLALNPELTLMLPFHATLLFGLGAHQRAIPWFVRTLHFQPSPDHYNLLGLSLHFVGRNEDSLSAFATALHLNPHFHQAATNRANTQTALGDYRAAQQDAAIAMAIIPDGAEPYVNLATALYLDGQIEPAIAKCEQALILNQHNNAARLNLGSYLLDKAEYDRGYEVLVHAVALNPQTDTSYLSISRAFQQYGNAQASIKAGKRAVILAPHAIMNAQSYLLQLQYSDLTSAEIYREHCACADNIFPVSPRPDPPVTRSEKLRIGFASGDFRTHPGGFLFLPLIRNLDPDLMTTFCYSNWVGSNVINEEIKKAAQFYRSVSGLPADKIADLIRHDQLDILVDLSGHTHGNLLAAFARRPARVQMSWLGYFDTTGCKFMDFAIMDQDMAPITHEEWFREKVLRLPHGRFCYAPPPYLPPIGPLPALKNGYVTFGCFNNILKLTDATISAWAEIMKRLPQARLILKWLTLGDQGPCQRLYQLLARHGIDTARVELRGKSSHEDMLVEYNDIDIALDPFPFPGGLTTIEALMMGLPVISLAGSRSISRQSLSLMNSASMAELVTFTEADYINLAVDWSNDPQRLSIWRSRARGHLLSSSLCNGQQFALDFTEICTQALVQAADFIN
jgi:predicted O-linked N-acetylglucosamine transferase (SPINDLY family)